MWPRIPIVETQHTRTKAVVCRPLCGPAQKENMCRGSITISEAPKMRKTMKTATCGTGAGEPVTLCAGNAVTVTLVILVLPLPRYRGISAHAHIDHGLHPRKTGLIVVRASCLPAQLIRCRPTVWGNAGETPAPQTNKQALQNACYDAIFSLPDKYGQTCVIMTFLMKGPDHGNVFYKYRARASVIWGGILHAIALRQIRENTSAFDG